jgi:hypothetical protein
MKVRETSVAASASERERKSHPVFTLFVYVGAVALSLYTQKRTKAKKRVTSSLALAATEYYALF